MLCAFLVILTMAGGGSRADIAGQVIVRAAVGIAFAFAALTYPNRPLGAQRWVPLLLLLALSLPLMQLIPLPPVLWQALPCRMLALSLPTDPTLWRPISIMPGGTINAAFALTVPLATFLLLTIAIDYDRLPGFLLALILLSALLGALQFTGAGLYIPLVNTMPGSVVGFFANRNHFALFLAIGCVIAPVWGFAGRRLLRWRAFAAPALCAVLLLLILATGSRAGTVLGAVALILGTLIAWKGIKVKLRSLSPRMGPVVVAATIGIMGAILLSAVVFGRAESINRALTLNEENGERVAAMPVVISMVASALPLGNGFGTFDVAFRRVEPMSLLKPTYFNHAHNDFLEVILDGGFPGFVVLVLAIVWWISATIKLWRRQPSQAVLLGRTGSAILLVIAGASLVDYPGRTPLILGMITIAATWLARGTRDLEDDIADASPPRP